MDEKLRALEEMMELDEGTLKGDEKLEDIEEWDSMTALSFILLLNDDYGKEVGGEQIKALETVQDMLRLMEAE